MKRHGPLKVDRKPRISAAKRRKEHLARCRKNYKKRDAARKAKRRNRFKK